MKTIRSNHVLYFISIAGFSILFACLLTAKTLANQKVSIGSKEKPLPVKASVLELSNAISDVAEKTTKVVVSIHAEKVIEVQPHQYFNPFEDFFRNDPFGDFFNRRSYPPQKQLPKQKHKQQGMGSGVIVSEQGYILTNHHVVGEADTIFVTLTDKRKFEAEIIGSDKESDVAVIKIKEPPENLPVARIGNSNQVKIGEFVIAIGSPFGYSNTVTSGIISAKGRTTGLNLFENYIQTDASINPGNSGGALLNLKGELIGINTAIASRSGGSQGIGFAIPINMAKHIMEDILYDGQVKRGYLGVYLQDMDNNLLDYFGIKELKGALVTKVIDDSPAEKAGFKPQDLIIKVNGEVIKDMNHCRNLVALLEPDETTTFTIIRNKKEMELKVSIGERQNQLVSANEKGRAPLGLNVENIQEEHLRKYQLAMKEGVVVTRIEMGSNADKAGFHEGDVILEINNVKVKSVDGLKDELRKTKGAALILIDRRGVQQFLGLKVSE